VRHLHAAGLAVAAFQRSRHAVAELEVGVRHVRAQRQYRSHLIAIVVFSFTVRKPRDWKERRRIDVDFVSTGTRTSRYS